MKEQTCFFTGHRGVPKKMVPALKKRLKAEIEKLIGQGVTEFCAGGALGFDTLASKAVLRMRRKHRQIRLALVLPCRDQDAKWRWCDRFTYRRILSRCDEASYITESYAAGCMHARNREMAKRSGFCICYLTKESGGTAYTVACARKLGVKIVNVA